MEGKVSQSERVRTHSAINNQPQIARYMEKIPVASCIEPFPKAREMCDLGVASFTMQTTSVVVIK